MTPPREAAPQLYKLPSALRDALGHEHTFGVRLSEAFGDALPRWAEESDALATLLRAMRDPAQLDVNDWSGFWDDVAKQLLDDLGRPTRA